MKDLSFNENINFERFRFEQSQKMYCLRLHQCYTNDVKKWNQFSNRLINSKYVFL